jgi:hypothetical protein
VTGLASSSSVFDQPGTLGFLVVFGMAVILFFVFRSLARHLRKLNDAARLEAEQAEAAAKPGDGGQQAAGSADAESGSGEPQPAIRGTARPDSSEPPGLPVLSRRARQF